MATMSAGELFDELKELIAKSPLGRQTPLYLETPDGHCQIRALNHEIDFGPDDCADEPGTPIGTIEAEPAAFPGSGDEY